MRRTLLVTLIALVAALALPGCAPPTGIDLAPVGRTDLSGPPSFCNMPKEGQDQGKLVITVKNLGSTDAPASTTSVEFSAGGAVQLPTQTIVAGGSADIAADVPAECFNPDCEFTIQVDSAGQINEGNEQNNAAEGNCLG